MKKLLFYSIICISLLSSFGTSAQYVKDSLIEASGRLKGQSGQEIQLAAVLNHLHEYYISSEPEKAKSLLLEAQKLTMANGSKYEQALSYSRLGYFYHRLAKYYQSLDCYQKGYELLLQNSMADSSGYMLSAMGTVYYDNELLTAAGNYYTKAESVFQRISDSTGIALAWANMGLVNEKLRRFDSALVYFNKAYDIRKRIGKPFLEAFSFKYISRVYLEMGNPVEALSYMNEALIVMQALELSKPEEFGLKAEIYELRAECFKKLKLYPDSRKNLELAEQTLLEYSYDPEALSRIAAAKGRLHLEQGMAEEAFLEAGKGLILAEKSENISGRLGAYNLMADIYETRKDFAEALRFRNLHRNLSDSSENAKLSSKFVELQSFVDVFEREQKLQLQDAEIKNQELRQLGLVIIIGLSAIVLIISIYALRRQRINNRLLAAKNEEISAQQKTLAELNATKDRLFSIIGHDLRNPFNTLISLSDIQMEELKSINAEASNYAKIINDSARKGFNLLENLLDWSRSQSGKIEVRPLPLNMNEVVEQAIGVCGAMATAKDISIKKQTDGTIAIADANTVNTVLRNLLSNAIKFTPSGGEVTVRVYAKEDWVNVEVSDTGIGMSETDLAKLFRLDVPNSEIGKNASGKNTGLGLILCKDFVEKNGGAIWVESEEGKGSSFSFTLPLHAKTDGSSTEETYVTKPATPELSAEDKKQIELWLQSFLKFELYETSELKKCLGQLQTGNSEALSNWKRRMEQAVFTSDEKAYRELLGLIH